MELILSRENLIEALKRVEKNKGSHGIDGMSVKSLRRHLYENWDTLCDSLRKGTYQPNPVRRVEIPKPNGGVRKLGIPTVMDRFLQQAIAQILTQLYDPTFSERSFGFRPHRRGHNAVRQAKQWMKEKGKNAIVKRERVIFRYTDLRVIQVIVNERNLAGRHKKQKNGEGRRKEEGRRVTVRRRERTALPNED